MMLLSIREWYMDRKKLINQSIDYIMKHLDEDTIIIPIYDRVVTCAYNKGVTVDRSYDSGFSTLRDMHWD